MAHLHAIPATASPSAILIKRGPGRLSGVIGWDRATDTFQMGQWIKDRLDHDTADLSPDGRFFVYWVNQQRWGEEHNVYLAVSLFPWLKAKMFWSETGWIYGPGVGMFLQGADGVLRLETNAASLRWDDLKIPVIPKFSGCSRSGDDVKSYLVRRLLRDGWLQASPPENEPEDAPAAGVKSKWKKQTGPVLEKTLPGGWRLRQRQGWSEPGKTNAGIRREYFALISPDGEVQPQPGWEWADWDADRNRLIWTEDCVLYAAGFFRNGFNPATVLLDTREMRFAALKAPY